ncbi:hypothetical protein AB3S75_002875 [Citrus x aurantiifolia]
MNPILSYSNRLPLASSHHLMARGEGIKNLSGHLPRIFYDVKVEDLVPVALWEGVLGFFVTFESILPKVNSDDIAFGGWHTSDMNLAEAKCWILISLLKSMTMTDFIAANLEPCANK